MKKIIKLILTNVLAILLAFNMLSCTDVQSRKPVDRANVDVWGCSFYEKILRDKPSTDYSDIRTDATIDIFMAKGEFQSAQIVITPKVKVYEYNVSVSSLKLVGGDDSISGDNLQVRKAKYIQVVKNTSMNGAPIGYYPDAMLPFSSAVEYEENYINENENQSIYLTVETDLDQTPGVYTGTMNLDFIDFMQSVPITVNVVDLTISEEPHAKNCYLATWNSAHGELDTTQGLRDAYYQALIDHRLAPSLVLKENDHSTEMVKEYVNTAFKWLSNPKCSNVGIPYAETTELYNGKSYNCIDKNVFERYLDAFMAKSLETGVNIMEKLVFYNAVIDEAFYIYVNRPKDQVRINYKVMNNTIAKVVKKYENITVANETFKNEIIESLKVLPCILTCQFSEEYIEGCVNENGYINCDCYINCYCPLYDFYDSEENRAYYDREEVVEKWWYGCNYPRDPYPSTHTDVTDTVALRVLGWMQAEYGIVGNLNWAVDYYVTYGAEKRDVFVEDYYGENADRTKGDGGAAANGDGYLFYPGGQYGLDTPVASLRVDALRDAMEEYEVIYALKEQYRILGFSADTLMENLGKSMHIGAQVTCSSRVYEEMRQKLYALAIAANSEGGLCIVDSTDLANGQFRTKIFVKDGVEIKNHGQLLTNGVSVEGGKIYTIITNLENTANSIDLTYTINGKEYSYNQNLGGKVVYLGAQDLLNSFKSDSATIDSSVVNGEIFDTTLSLLKILINPVQTGQQRILFEDNCLTQLDAKVNKITFVLYNGNSEDLKISAYVKHAKTAYEMYEEYTLKAGERTIINISLSGINWVKKGKLNSIRFKIDESKTNSINTLYVESFLVSYN